MTSWTIRPATEGDLEALAAIYDRETYAGYATFDTEPQGIEPFRARLAGEDHLLVGCDGEQVLGYAYSAPFRTRGAYAATRETTVYLHPDAQGGGLSKVYEVTPEDLGDYAASSVMRVEVDGEPGVGYQVVQVVRVGQAVLQTLVNNDGDQLDGTRTPDEVRTVYLENSQSVVDEMN